VGGGNTHTQGGWTRVLCARNFASMFKDHLQPPFYVSFRFVSLLFCQEILLGPLHSSGTSPGHDPLESNARVLLSAIISWSDATLLPSRFVPRCAALGTWRERRSRWPVETVVEYREGAVRWYSVRVPSTASSRARPRGRKRGEV
jgi:hypothetical protein